MLHLVIELAEPNVDWIAETVQVLTISMDSAVDRVNDECRGVHGATQRTKNGLRLLRALPNRPFTRIHAVISALTLPFLDEFLKLIDQGGVDEFGAALVNGWSFVPTQMLFREEETARRDRTLEVFARALASRGVRLAGCLNPIMRNGLIRHAAGHGVAAAGRTTTATNTCYGLWSTATIRPNGDVSVCCFTYKPKLGTLRSAGFTEVWQSLDAAKMREAVKTGHYLDEQCRGCEFGSPEMNVVASMTDSNVLSELHDIILAAR